MKIRNRDRLYCLVRNSRAGEHRLCGLFHQRLPVRRLASQAAGGQPLSPTAVPVQSRPTAVAVAVASTATPPTAPAQGAAQVLPAGQGGDLVLDQSVLEKVYNTVNPSVVTSR